MSSAKPIRVGIAGARFAAAFHLESMQGVRGVPLEVVGVTSTSPESRAKFAAAHDVKAFDSIDALIAGCDVVDVCTPPYAHEEITVKAAAAGRHVIVEKPFTGSFLNREEYEAQKKPKLSFNEQRYVEATGSAKRMADAVKKAGVAMCFAENWHFLPSGLKACRLMMRSMFKKRLEGASWKLTEPDPGARVMLIRGSEAHSGSGSPVYGDLQFAGGGAIMGKACHPLGFALYLKRLEGIVRNGKPIEPVAVRGTCGYITYGKDYRDPDYQTPKKVRRGYKGGEDWGLMVVRFADETFAEIEANEFTLGGVANTFEVLSNKFRLQGNVSPNDAVKAYAPSPDVFEPEYLVEKLETAGGWSFPAMNENFTMGYIEEMQVFFDRIAAISEGRKPKAEPPYLPPDDDVALAVDSVRVMYGAYVSDERKGAEVELAEMDKMKL
ncbi:MAG TPA: Gfo/Idh/MocA family oxidoreductase [Planctomycetota bacterium]|nr:Gfo/Idh/MocA family oxidoreductase [Planctomycetota bacterium]